ncbi:LPS assembly protein LptD, partial [Salmonella enterica subsp. enterica serovar Montevideo]|nr:LPS assembly protein LptD [Salmonella enterica subsp. enterica serovar Montevideo]
NNSDALLLQPGERGTLSFSLAATQVPVKMSTITLMLASSSSEAKLMATHYQQTNLDWYNANNSKKLEDSVNRVMPQFKVDGKL